MTKANDGLLNIKITMLIISCDKNDMVDPLFSKYYPSTSKNLQNLTAVLSKRTNRCRGIATGGRGGGGDGVKTAMVPPTSISEPNKFQLFQF